MQNGWKRKKKEKIKKEEKRGGEEESEKTCQSVENQMKKSGSFPKQAICGC